MTPVHVTFVCTGNICRSPMAEKIVAESLVAAGLDGRVRVTSAGTGDWHVGDPADPRAVAELEAHGYPSAHRARTIDEEILGADLVVALDRSHERELRRLGVTSDRLALLRSFDPDADSDSVADPYYGTEADFGTVREQIEAALPGLLEDLSRR
ncbi:protein tyrosine phosphatase [Rhodococcus sp. Leaf7]|uniref:low molecular weight protein-tyrosine-phosphatase n=1 Tax=unclassified Rhodococcus (in: high G+C Gram-positive bacteria) TaxID=192944 RepID=UPI0006F82DD2|nr:MULTISPECIES: low molecular weight protein-tyrosine-phosphatase [unclassified Rhodococcus (in: high G+C Gram-positive bacteria)]KQU02583.1 protein tyrosine phosphatase [Rhodococcus sp. Leaf7]KQU38054.1 protein tyrosine phosphatase [Rhodococcus sp. Leaf247]